VLNEAMLVLLGQFGIKVTTQINAFIRKLMLEEMRVWTAKVTQ